MAKNDNFSTCPRGFEVFPQSCGGFLYFTNKENCMKKHLKRLLSVMLAALLCLGIVPSSVFAAEYEYDGYISMIDHR